MSSAIGFLFLALINVYVVVGSEVPTSLVVGKDAENGYLSIQFAAPSSIGDKTIDMHTATNENGVIVGVSPISPISPIFVTNKVTNGLDNQNHKYKITTMFTDGSQSSPSIESTETLAASVASAPRSLFASETTVSDMKLTWYDEQRTFTFSFFTDN